MDFSNPFLLIAVVVMSLVSAGVLATGLGVGYVRGVRRGKQLSEVDDRKEDELERLVGIGRAILGVQLKLDALCEVVYQQSSRLVDTRNFQLGLFEGSDYNVKVWVRSGERLTSQCFVGRGVEGLVGHVRKTAQGLIIGDYQRDWATLPAKPTYEAVNPPRSALFAPLIATGEVIGVIAVQSDEPDAFTPENLRTLTVLANQAAAALRNAQLYEQTRERARQLRLINEITQQITAVQPLPSLFRQIVSAIQRAFGFYAVNVFILDSQEDLIRLGASTNPEYETRKIGIMPGQGMVGVTYHSGKTINATDVTKDPNYLQSRILTKTRSEICVPLKIEERVLGVLDVQSDQLNAFSGDTIVALESLAGQLALALQEAQTYAAERRQSERVNALVNALQAVVSILNIEDLMDEVVDLVTDYFGYDRVHLFIRSGDRVLFRAGSGVHSGRWAAERLTYHIDDNGFIPCVTRLGQPLMSGEVFTDVHYVPGPGVEDTRSEMTVPLKVGNRVLGVFDIQSTQPDAFNGEDLTLMQALADTVAVGLRNASLFAAETRRRILAETLREVSLVIASSLDLESVLDGILEGLERVVSFQAALIALTDEKSDYYDVSAVRAHHATANILDMQISVSGDLENNIFKVLRQLGSADEKEGIIHNPLTVPLQMGGERIGYMAIDRIGLDRFNPEEVEIINTFAGQAAIAISNAQLYMAQREQAWVSNALLQVAESTSRATSLDEVLSTVARITPGLAGVEWCAVFLDEDGVFRVVEIEGVRSAEVMQAFKGYTIHPTEWSPLVSLRDTGRPVLLDIDSPQPKNAPFHLNNISHAVLLPLYAKGELMGAMLIGQQDGTEALTARKIELVSGIANQAALAIESAQLFAAQQEEQWVTTVLLRVAESVNSTVDYEETLRNLVRLTQTLVGTKFCGIMEWHDSERCFVGRAVDGLSKEAEKHFRSATIPVSTDPFAQIIYSSQDIMAFGQGQPSPMPPVLYMLKVDAILALPLIAKGALLGVMLVDHQSVGERADQRRMNILTGTAQQFSLAMETGRLQADSMLREKMEKELEVAQGIQRSFLPSTLPNLPGCALSVFYRAARQVGGDFYDFIPLRSGKWGVVVADVADKGVPAALFMVLSRTNLRAAAFSRESPAETLRRVNELLLSDSRSDLFVTVWYGVFDPAQHEIVYANAGHNPPLVLHSGGQFEELTAPGMALGVMPEMRLEERRIKLTPGDTLIAYTDGVTEAIRADNSEFGVVGLQRAAYSVRRQAASDMMKVIVQAVDQFTQGQPQFDDVTLVLIKREQ
jgi:GAF domain-containing protein